MTETINELIDYVKKPILEKDENTTFSYRFKKLISLFIISLATSFFFTILISTIEKIGLINSENHSIENLFEELTPIHFFIFAVILAPLIEECIFRAPLTLFNNKKVFKIAYYVFAIVFGFVHISNYEITNNILLFSPILIAPQLFIGLYLGFIRVRFGLLWSIALHAIYNGFLVSLFFLAKDAII